MQRYTNSRPCARVDSRSLRQSKPSRLPRISSKPVFTFRSEGGKLTWHAGALPQGSLQGSLVRSLAASLRTKPILRSDLKQQQLQGAIGFLLHTGHVGTSSCEVTAFYFAELPAYCLSVHGGACAGDRLTTINRGAHASLSLLSSFYHACC